MIRRLIILVALLADGRGWTHNVDTRPVESSIIILIGNLLPRVILHLAVIVGERLLMLEIAIRRFHIFW